MHDRQITGIQPAILQRFLCRCRVLQITAHDSVGSQHQHPDRFPILGHINKGFRIRNALFFQGDHCNPLSRHQGRAFRQFQPIPIWLPGTHRCWAIAFRHAVHMRDVKAHTLHLCDHRRRWCCAPCTDLNPLREFNFLVGRGMDQHGQHNWCPAHMRHRMIADHWKNQRRIDTP